MSASAALSGHPAAPPGAGASAALPALREELLLHTAPAHHDGSPAWTLEDPGRGQFFQISWVEAEILSRWHLGSATRIAHAISQETALQVSEQDVTDFARFTQQHSLVQARGQEAVARLQREAKARQSGGWASLALKHYLFFRIPLLHPDAFLTRTLPWVRRVFLNQRFAWLTAFAGVLGLSLATRQWDEFVHTFLHFFTLEGAALAAITLGATKMLHELGHAYAAKHHGCRVATMGVAFMVMWPVLYTDTSGAWRLSSRRKRLSIGAAGMATETALAAWATLAWSFLPDGMLRSAAFMLATTTWLLTLVINLSPLMRFDGYFLLADALNVPNLQHRAFALTRWWLRERLFGFGDEKPEHFAPWRERTLIVYALAVWVYRFFLFLGIALLVYHMAFKLLGIVLFVIEIVVFVLLPIVTELAVWFKRMKSNPKADPTNPMQASHSTGWNRRSRTTLAILLVALAAALVPWRTRVEAPAMLRAEQQTRLLAPAGSQLQKILVQPGQTVKAGTPLYVLSAPDLAHEIDSLEQRMRVLRWQLSFQSMRQDSAATVPVAQRELAAAQERHAVLARQQAQLTVKALFDGILADQAEPLATGEWLAAGEWLGTLVAPGSALVEAYVAEDDLHRLQTQGRARFLPEDPAVGAMPLRVSDIAATASRRLSATPELASVHGGGIAAVQAPVRAGEQDADQHALAAQRVVYRVLLHPDAAHGSDAAMPRLQALRGTAILDGEAESLVARAWRRSAAIVVREFGF